MDGKSSPGVERRNLMAYRRRFKWLAFRDQYGHVRWSYKRGPVMYPVWMDNAQFLAEHLWLRVQLRCISCRMRGVHKMDCYHSWTIRDDLRAFRLWPKRRYDQP